jgi:hypothetical protein
MAKQLSQPGLWASATRQKPLAPLQVQLLATWS